MKQDNVVKNPKSICEDGNKRLGSGYSMHVDLKRATSKPIAPDLFYKHGYFQNQHYEKNIAHLSNFTAIGFPNLLVSICNVTT